MESVKVATFKTKFTQLVSLKKKEVQKSEKEVQQKNVALQNAKDALKNSYISLGEVTYPTDGKMTQLLASRSLLQSARIQIEHNQEWIAFAQTQLDNVSQQLKLEMIEYEKYKYLELQEIKKIMKQIKIAEAKELDEIALMTFNKKKGTY
jgi:flagellar biosynthesis chaperone FliJ